MEVGNWLTPVIVFAVSITLLLKLFSRLEATQDELNRERSRQAVLEEREKLARELHDGIAQSIFLLSVKLNQFEQEHQGTAETESISGFRKTVHQVNEYVRQAISSLRHPVNPEVLPLQPATSATGVTSLDKVWITSFTPFVVTVLVAEAMSLLLLLKQ